MNLIKTSCTSPRVDENTYPMFNYLQIPAKISLCNAYNRIINLGEDEGDYIKTIQRVTNLDELSGKTIHIGTSITPNELRDMRLFRYVRDYGYCYAE